MKVDKKQVAMVVGISAVVALVMIAAVFRFPHLEVAVTSKTDN
jgi:hypothetical protein